MFCLKCGNKLDARDAFCIKCGTKVQRANEAMNIVDTPEEIQKNVESFDYENLPTVTESGIKSFYIVDFAIRMMDKSNIPLFIYLIINVIIIGFIATLFLQVPVGWGMLSGLLVYIASVSIALSPIGEWMLRHQTGCREINEREVVERMEPLFREVYYKAKKENPMISRDVRLFINEDDCPNAFATGRKTICITRGLLSMSDEEIKGTLAHEFGHLSHKDTDRILVVSVGNTVITAICVMFQVAAIVSEIFMNIVALFTNDDNSFVINIFAAISRFITVALIGAFMKVWSAVGVALCMKTSRGNEYIADEFAWKLGFGDELCTMLSRFSSLEEKPQGLFASLASSHPESRDRISRIQTLTANTTIAG